VLSRLKHEGVSLVQVELWKDLLGLKLIVVVGIYLLVRLEREHGISLAVFKLLNSPLGVMDD
jgi:hypothetical protein